MKKILAFLFVAIVLSGCYVEKRFFVHRHPWSRMNRVHNYYWLKKYEAPNKIYRKRGFE